MIRTIAILVLCLASLGAQATIYKWVDDNGIAQYTSVPPQDRSYEVVEHTTSGELRRDPDGDLARLRKQAAEIDKKQAERKEAQVQAAADAEATDKREVLCEQARANLTTLEEHTRLLLVDAETGVERRIGEEERQAQIAQTHRDIGYFCDS